METESSAMSEHPSFRTATHPTRMRAALIVASFVVAGTAMLHAQTPPSPTTLATLRDHYRPLLLFAASPDDPSLLAQLIRLKDHAPGLDERNVLVIAIPYNNPAPTAMALTPGDALDARHRFRIAPADFTAILLGKDGGEKLRSTRPVSFEKLRDKIDSMPMRQTEMHPGSPR